MIVTVDELVLDLTTRTLVASTSRDAGADLRINAAGDPSADGVPVLTRVDQISDLHRIRPTGAAVLLVAAGSEGTAAVGDWLQRAATEATIAGLAPSAVILDAGLDAASSADEAVALLAMTADLVASGHPVSVCLDGCAGPAASVAAAGIAAGSRILRSVDIRTARRSADLMEVLLLERSGVRA